MEEAAEAAEDIPLNLQKRPELVEQKVIAANAAKDRGNGYLKEGAVDEAIESYSLAIQLDSSNHVFYSNRCAALQQKKMWALAVADAEQVSDRVYEGNFALIYVLLYAVLFYSILFYSI